MKLETRLGLCAVFGLVATLGLAVMLYIYLPAGVEEYVRRDAEERNSQAAALMSAELKRLGDRMNESLAALASDLPETSTESENITPEQVELAGNLAGRYGFDELYLIEKDARLRSAWPQAARIGMKDAGLLEKARAASQKAVFTVDKSGELFIARSRRIAERSNLTLLALLHVEKDELKHLASGIGLKFSGIIAGTEDKTPEGTYALPLEGPGGERTATLHLSVPEPQSRMLLRALSRRILFVAVPWGLLTALVLVWLGWPPRRRTDGKR